MADLYPIIDIIRPVIVRMCLIFVHWDIRSIVYYVRNVQMDEDGAQLTNNADFSIY